MQYFEFLAGPGPVLVVPVFVVAVAALARLVRTYLVLRFCRDLVRETGGTECLRDAAAVLRALDPPRPFLLGAGAARPSRRPPRRAPPTDAG